jgi:hypothetical protein
MPPRVLKRDPAAIALALASVALTKPDAEGRRRVGRNSLAESVIGDRSRTGGKREGRNLWKDVLGRGHCQLPLPASRKERLDSGGAETEVYDAKDVPAAVRKLLGVRSAAELFVQQVFEVAMKELLVRCGEGVDGWEVTLADVRSELENREKMLAPFRSLPSLLSSGSSGGGIMTFRATFDDECGLVLSSVHDQMKWMGLDADDQHHEWKNWLRVSMEARIIQLEAAGKPSPALKYLKLPGEKHPTPMGCHVLFREIILACIHKSKIAKETGAVALDIYARFRAKDQRLHDELDDGPEVPAAAKAFVLGPEEAARQLEEPCLKRRKTAQAAVDLDAFERSCLEDDDLDPDVAARRLAKAALARQYREQAGRQIAVIKRHKLADVEKYEEETRAHVETLKAETSAKVAKLVAERKKTEIEHAELAARKKEVEDKAKADEDDRMRQRLHAEELAVERRRAEVRAAASRGEILQEAAQELLAEERRTPISKLEAWLGKCVGIHGASCRCDAPSGCSSELGRQFNEAVRTGRHVKPQTHWNALCQKWKLFEEHDGAMLRLLHLEIHDRRSGVRPGQTRLTAFTSPATVAAA